MNKRAADLLESDFQEKSKRLRPESGEKHTLDSDEEDSGDDDERYNIMNENDIEGEEDGISGMEGEVKITPFNMKEELEEGHFDREGHFQWKKDALIKDNWLDNIDWVKVKTNKKYIERTNRGLADSSDSDDDDEQAKIFNEMGTYQQLLDHMKPGETVKKTLLRLGGNTAKLSSAERWKRKKAGIVDDNAELVAKFTELANNILTQMGNMDVYQETYEQIKGKIIRSGRSVGASASAAGGSGGDLDMYADDFVDKETSKLGVSTKDDNDGKEENKDENEEQRNKMRWEYKWKESDSEVHGPFSTEQMLNWSNEGYFKPGAVARKVGDDTKFYSLARIDFDLYL